MPHKLFWTLIQLRLSPFPRFIFHLYRMFNKIWFFSRIYSILSSSSHSMSSQPKRMELDQFPNNLSKQFQAGGRSGLKSRCLNYNLLPTFACKCDYTIHSLLSSAWPRNLYHKFTSKKSLSGAVSLGVFKTTHSGLQIELLYFLVTWGTWKPLLLSGFHTVRVRMYVSAVRRRGYF